MTAVAPTTGTADNTSPDSPTVADPVAGTATANSTTDNSAANPNSANPNSATDRGRRPRPTSLQVFSTVLIAALLFQRPLAQAL
ncbi:MAG: hypothetical protein QOD04_4446, partial [Pseudonocardiales bacterium]|nr:hypothetical protein [Pseudonocardiales bacterium]